MAIKMSRVAWSWSNCISWPSLFCTCNKTCCCPLCPLHLLLRSLTRPTLCTLFLTPSLSLSFSPAGARTAAHCNVRLALIPLPRLYSPTCHDPRWTYHVPRRRRQLRLHSANVPRPAASTRPAAALPPQQPQQHRHRCMPSWMSITVTWPPDLIIILATVAAAPAAAEEAAPAAADARACWVRRQRDAISWLESLMVSSAISLFLPPHFVTMQSAKRAPCAILISLKTAGQIALGPDASRSNSNVSVAQRLNGSAAHSGCSGIYFATATWLIFKCALKILWSCWRCIKSLWHIPKGSRAVHRWKITSNASNSAHDSKIP